MLIYELHCDSIVILLLGSNMQLDVTHVFSDMRLRVVLVNTELRDRHIQTLQL